MTIILFKTSKSSVGCNILDWSQSVKQYYIIFFFVLAINWKGNDKILSHRLAMYILQKLCRCFIDCNLLANSYKITYVNNECHFLLRVLIGKNKTLSVTCCSRLSSEDVKRLVNLPGRYVDLISRKICI